MTDTIWLVSGETGEYSDQAHWSVRAFQTEAEAEAFAEKLRKWDAILPVGAWNCLGWRDMLESQKKVMRDAGDPNWIRDYTGTFYYVCEIPVGMVKQHGVEAP